MPERLPYLENAVESLRPQVDALRVYLNNFEEVPPFLSRDEAQLSSDAIGDLGDSGKFYWFDGKTDLDHTHYLTVDDDLGYPSSYVAALVEEFDTRDGKAIVGVHGSTFSLPIRRSVSIPGIDKVATMNVCGQIALAALEQASITVTVPVQAPAAVEPLS